MDDAPAPRRSRRDPQPSTKAAAALATSPHDAAPFSPSVAPVAAAALPQRRSERHAKAASAATPDKSGEAPDADGSVDRRDRRRALASASPARGITSAPSTAPSSPVRPRTASAHVVASVGNSPALSSTHNRRRRPAGRSSAITMAGDAAGAASDGDRSQQTTRVLGKHSARECTLLCEVILDHVRRNALAADVLERDRSPASIRWDKVAKRMLKTHHLSMTPRECQVLWKFLAYAESPEREDSNSTGASAQGDTDMLPASDEEDIERPIHEIHARRQNAQSRKQKQRARLLSFTNRSTPSSPRHGEAVVSEKARIKRPGAERSAGCVGEDSTIAEHTSKSEPETSGAIPTSVPSLKPSSSARLYPTYELPPNSLEGWQRPFDVKKMLPLTFVAEKFLKKRTAPIPKTPMTTAAAATKSASGAKTEAKAGAGASSMEQIPTPSTQIVAPSTASSNVATTASTASAASATAMNTAVPVTPSVAKSEGATTTAAKPTKKRTIDDASTPNNTPAGATAKPGKPAKKKKTQSIKPVSTSSSNQPRAPFTPSTTPPPVPTPARTALDFFRLVHARLNDGSGAATPTHEELATFFQSAAPAIQEECKKLALIDVERFNRECVRRRIWEKAMGAGSQSNSPLASPAVASSSSGSSIVTTKPVVAANDGEASESSGDRGAQSGGLEVSSAPQEGRSALSSG